jgi:hypothetical protein
VALGASQAGRSAAMMSAQATAVRPSKPKVTAVILNWNGRDDTLASLDSLHAEIYPNSNTWWCRVFCKGHVANRLRSRHPEDQLRS